MNSATRISQPQTLFMTVIVANEVKKISDDMIERVLSKLMNA